MIERTRHLWAAAAVLAMAVVLLACGPGQPVETEPPTATPSPGAETPVPATDAPAALPDSPLPTPARETRPTPEATRLPDLVPGATPGSPVTGEVPAGLLDAILADLAGRLGAGVDEIANEIEVVRGESVVWNDGSLGCPQSGVMYTQALVDGYWVVLEHGGQSYDYRASQSGSFVLCEGGLSPIASPSMQIVEDVTMPISPAIPTPSSPALQALVAQARGDLAQRLSVPVEQIDLVELTAVVWPDGALGCPQPGVAYIQVQQEGLLIRLRVGKAIYAYHSGGGKPPFLCQQAVEGTSPQ